MEVDWLQQLEEWADTVAGDGGEPDTPDPFLDALWLGGAGLVAVRR